MTKINYNNLFSTGHTRDYYRGQSFHYAGKWVAGSHYTSDDYVIDFVSKDGALLACAKSHLSTVDNEPKNWVTDENNNRTNVISSYWDFVMAGVSGNSSIVSKSITYNTSNIGIIDFKLPLVPALKYHITLNETMGTPRIIDLDIYLSQNSASNYSFNSGACLEKSTSTELEVSVRPGVDGYNHLVIGGVSSTYASLLLIEAKVSFPNNTSINMENIYTNFITPSFVTDTSAYAGEGTKLHNIS